MPLISRSFSRSFRYGRAVTVTSFVTDDCGISQTIIPSPDDDYTLSDLGPPDPPNTYHDIDNGFVKYRVNGYGSGALGGGDGPNYLNELGLKFDSTGTGNYGVDDYIQPGTPWEGYTFEIDGKKFIGSNSGYVGDYDVYLAKTWRLADNHVVSMIGDKENYGLGVCQYMSLPEEPAIRIKMTYTNTTSTAKTVKISRGMDPDVDVFEYGYYSTFNTRGIGSIPKADIALAYGNFSGKPVAIYAPGNGFLHNTSIDYFWPQEIPDNILKEIFNQEDRYADDAITVALDCKMVEPGQSVTICVYYLCASTEEEILDIIGTTETTLPQPNFRPNLFFGFVPQTINFINQSKSAIQYQWDFTNDGIIDSTDVNPTYTYSSPGLYSIALTAINPNGSKTVVADDMITIINACSVPSIPFENLCTPCNLEAINNEVAWYKFINTTPNANIKFFVTSIGPPWLGPYDTPNPTGAAIAIYSLSDPGIYYSDYNYDTGSGCIVWENMPVGEYGIAIANSGNDVFGVDFEPNLIVITEFPYPVIGCNFKLTIKQAVNKIDFQYNPTFYLDYEHRQRYILNYNSGVAIPFDSASEPNWGPLLDSTGIYNEGSVVKKFNYEEDTIYLTYRLWDNLKGQYPLFIYKQVFVRFDVRRAGWVYIFVPGIGASSLAGLSAKKVDGFWYIFACIRDQKTYYGTQKIVRIKIWWDETANTVNYDDPVILHNLNFEESIVVPDNPSIGTIATWVSRPSREQTYPTVFNDSCTEAMFKITHNFTSWNGQTWIADYLNSNAASWNNFDQGSIVLIYTITGLTVTAEFKQPLSLITTNSFSYEFDYTDGISNYYDVYSTVNLNGDVLIGCDYNGDTRKFLKATISSTLYDHTYNRRWVSQGPPVPGEPDSRYSKDFTWTNTETIDTGWSTLPSKTRITHYSQTTFNGDKTYSGTSNAGGYYFHYWSPKINVISYTEYFIDTAWIPELYATTQFPMYANFKVNDELIYTSATIYSSEYNYVSGQYAPLTEITLVENVSQNSPLSYVCIYDNKFHGIFRPVQLSGTAGWYNFNTQFSGTTDAMFAVKNSDGTSKSQVQEAFGGSFIKMFGSVGYPSYDESLPIKISLSLL